MGLRLQLPIACTPGQDCFIQNFFDHDAGPQWQDYACGSLSYDAHTGTDFRLASMAEMRRGVEVLAAADGVVKALRDGEPDVMRHPDRKPVKGRAAGNGVVLDHGAGWETQYSHLRRGSIRVAKGQKVSAGDALGLVGLSGNTEFPHVDFSVRRDGKPVDPFAPQGRSACGTQVETLWHPAVAAKLAYQSSGVLQLGWAGGAPDLQGLREGRLPPAASMQSEMISFWVEMFGLQKGDVQRFELIRPDGQPVLVREIPVARNNAVRVTYVGAVRPKEGWMAGMYRANYRLLRSGVVSQVTNDFLLAE